MNDDQAYVARMRTGPLVAFAMFFGAFAAFLAYGAVVVTLANGLNGALVVILPPLALFATLTGYTAPVHLCRPITTVWRFDRDALIAAVAKHAPGLEFIDRDVPPPRP